MSGRTWAPPMAAYRMLRCVRAWPRMSRSSDVRMVDLFAVGLSAVLAAHLLPTVRALQRRHMAAANRGPRPGRGNRRLIAARRGLAGPCDRRRACGMLALGRVGLFPETLRDHQLGCRLLRRRICDRGAPARMERDCSRPAPLPAELGCGRPGDALHLSVCAFRTPSDRPALRPAMAAGRA